MTFSLHNYDRNIKYKRGWFELKRLAALFLAATFCMAGPGTALAMEPAGTFETTEISVSSDAVISEDTDAEETEAIDYAVDHIGYPYSMARRHSGEAFDCSSLVYYSYQDAGVDISNGGATTAAEIARGLSNAEKTVSSDDIQPGDLIFYSYERNGRYKNISHVAMYIGNGQQIEASYSKQQVAVRNVSFSNMVLIGRPCA